MKTKAPARSAILLAIVLLLLPLLAACGAEAETTTTATTSASATSSVGATTTATTSTAAAGPRWPVTLTDQLGREVTVQDEPQTIVSLAPGNTEILFALGLGDRVIGRTDYCNYPPEAASVPSIGGFSTPNIEEILALEPDLIVAANIHKDDFVPQLEGYGLTVLGLSPYDIDDVTDAIGLAGEATGTEDAALEIANDMQARVEAVTAKTGDLAEADKKDVLYIIWHDPLMAAGAGTFHDELIRLSGGNNIAGDAEGYPTLGMEAVIGADPDVIIAGVGMGDGEDLSLKFVQEEERLEATAARIHNAVYPMDMDIIGRPGPRIVEALEQFAAYIHPELFE